MSAVIHSPEDSARPAARERSVRLFNTRFRVVPPSIRDPRLHVAAVLLTLQALGQTVLHFRLSIAQIIACLVTGAVIEFLVAFFKDDTIMWPASGLLTGNSVAIILRVPGTLHGQWWSMRGVHIFVLVVAVSMASKYLVRHRGQHIFNPSNLGLVLAFLLLGPQWTEPQDLWWIPMGPWLIVTYVLLLGGGLWVGRRLGLLGMQVAFLAGFAVFVAVALAPVPDHCMVASWRLAPLCGYSLWQILVTSPELLVFGLFMLPDPKTVPSGKAGRVVFGVAVALFAAVLIGPTTLEFWTKTAILGSLVVACALRFPVASLLASARAERFGEAAARPGALRVAPLILVGAVLFGLLPLAADASTRSAQPSPGLADGSTPPVVLTVGAGPGLASWMSVAAGDALPAPQLNARPVASAGSARVWHLPAVPAVSLAAGVREFDPNLTTQTARQMGHDVVLDLVVEAEARRTLDLELARSGASGDGLKPFADALNRDRSAGVTVATVYHFDRAGLVVFLPKFSGQAPRLLGVTISGTATQTIRNATGFVVSQKTDPYAHSWALSRVSPNAPMVISNDYSDLQPAS